MFPYLKSKHIHIKYRGFLIKETSVKKEKIFMGELYYGILGTSFYEVPAIEFDKSKFDCFIDAKFVVQLDSFYTLYTCSKAHPVTPPLLLFLIDHDGKKSVQSYYGYENLFSVFNELLNTMKYIGIAQFPDLMCLL